MSMVNLSHPSPANKLENHPFAVEDCSYCENRHRAFSHGRAITPSPRRQRPRREVSFPFWTLAIVTCRISSTRRQYQRGRGRDQRYLAAPYRDKAWLSNFLLEPCTRGTNDLLDVVPSREFEAIAHNVLSQAARTVSLSCEKTSHPRVVPAGDGCARIARAARTCGSGDSVGS